MSTSPPGRQYLLGRFLGLVESQPEGIGHAQHLSGGTHLRSQSGSTSGKHVEGEDRFLYPKVRE